MRSESCSFIWHPKVRMKYVPLLVHQTTRLLGVGRRAASLPDHHDLDLARVLELLLDLLGDVAGDDLGLQVVDVGPA